MKKLSNISALTFFVGLISLLFYTFGLFAWDCRGVGLYPHESMMLLARILVMFGTAFYYGILKAILYPEETRKQRGHNKRHQF